MYIMLLYSWLDLVYMAKMKVVRRHVCISFLHFDKSMKKAYKSQHLVQKTSTRDGVIEWLLQTILNSFCLQ